jgi:putative ABC transport system permease protein
MFLLRLPFFLLILLYQSIMLALGQIWTNKVRAALTTVGIVIGVASVTAVIAALTGLKAKVLSEFEAFGANKMYIFPYWNGKSMRNLRWQDIRFKPEQFDHLLEHCPSVARFTRTMRTGWGSTISFNDRSEDQADITGIEPDWHQIENRSVTVGRPFTLVDNTQARPVCLINEKLRDKLGLDRDPTGQSILIGERRFRVVGIVETRTDSQMFGENQSGSEAFIPFNTALGTRRYPYITVVAAARSPDLADEARAEVSFYLRRQRHIKIGEPDNFRTEVIQSYIDRFNTVATTITMVAGGVVGISLLVGGVGIMNIMLVSVSERTREIGLRKAVGARPSAILLQFLVEAVMLCCLGGAIGVLCGHGLARAISHIPNANLDKAYIPAWAIALAFGFSASVGLIFGMFPAIKAARLDPIEALRHE